MKLTVKGVYEKRKRLSSGHVAVYCYDRGTGARVHGTPGTAEFFENLERIRSAAKADRTSERSFQHLAREYRRSVRYVMLAPRTREEYDRHIDSYLMPVFGDVPIAQVRRAHMTELMSQYSGTPALARAIKRTASVMWTFAIDGLNWIEAHPFLNMEGRRKRSAEGQLPLMEGEIGRFRAANPLGTRERLAFEIGLCSGLRLSDVIDLPADALAGVPEGVRTRKRGSVVILGLSTEALAAFAAYAAAQAADGQPIGLWVFPGGSEGRLHRRTLSGDMEEAFVRAAITDKRFHALRYTACIRLFEAGFGYDEIAQQVGHAMAAMAKKYCEKRRNAARTKTVMDAFDAEGAALAPSPASEQVPSRHGLLTR